MVLLNVGDKAPDFMLLDDEERNVSLEDFKDKKLVIYFYPKDDTPGCTMEAENFSAIADDLSRANTEVLGVSCDSVDSHKCFKNKRNLRVRLLADVGHIMASNYGVWVEKSMFGKKYMGMERATFLLDAKKNIKYIWRDVKVAGHAAEVLDKAKS